MAKKVIKMTQRQALEEWDRLIASIREASSVNPLDTHEEIMKRRARLEKDEEEWNRYYLSQFYTAEPAGFHLRAARRFNSHERLFEVLAWSRELAKTARKMMDLVRSALLGRIRNVLYISNSYDNAERLLAQTKAQFEANQRIIQDYGEQVTLGKWEAGEFTARCGCSFRALGAGQSPRGTRHKNYRPDCIVFDDIDTDEEVRNPDRIKQKWAWIERAVLPAMSVSGNYRISFLGNIIAPDCIITRAIDRAGSLPRGVGYVDIVNIRDEHGRSTWPTKNSEEDIDLFLSLVSYAAGQAEFFNNPISEGEVFSEMRWGKCPPLGQVEFLAVYADPASSNKGKKETCFKANFLLGLHQGTLYVYTGFLDKALNAEFIGWYFFLRDWATHRGARNIRYYIENNSLQDPFYDQVFVPLFRKIGQERGHIPISPDTRKKGDKYNRIEGNLEPLNRSGNLIFNIDERDNPHMRRLEEQFKLLTPQLRAPADGPDCIEGGWYVLNQLVGRLCATGITVGQRQRNKKRF